MFDGSIGTVPVVGIVAVTGSTGRLGGRVARRLAAAGTSQRLLVRDLARAPVLDDAEAMLGDFSDGASVEQSLAGVETLLMVSAAEAPNRVEQHHTFIDAAARAGVAHLVYVSFVGAAPDATFTLARDHWATEERIRASGMAFTFLRDNLYADFFVFMIGPDGALRGPAGSGRVAAVAQDDIADVAAAILLDPQPHRGHTYDLTGPQSLTLAEVAATITDITGRPVRYEPETVDEAYASRAHYDAPDWQLDAWVSTYTAIAAGELAGVSDAVETIAGHPPTALVELLRRSTP